MGDRLSSKHIRCTSPRRKLAIGREARRPSALSDEPTVLLSKTSFSVAANVVANVLKIFREDLSMEKKLRVLEMIDDAEIGSGQIHVLLLSKHLPKDRFEVSIACAGEGFLVDEARKLGIDVFPIDIDNRLMVTSYKELARLYRQHQFDIVHTHGGTAGFWGRGVSRLVGKPHVHIHTYHGIHYLGISSTVPRWFKHIDRSLLNVTDAVICVCKSDYEKGLAARIVSSSKASIVPYGIEIDRFRSDAMRGAARSSLHYDDTNFVFGNIGRLHVQKGQEYFLRAFQSVRQKHSQAKLLIIGEGDLRARLESLAKDLGIERDVQFVGSRTDIPNLLSAMDVFTLPSLWEGQPISLLEAMAASKPLIASRVDGIADILVDGQNGLLVLVKDSVGLAQAMMRLIGDAALRQRLSTAAYSTISEQYTAETMAKSVARLYQTISKQKRAKE